MEKLKDLQLQDEINLKGRKVSRSSRRLERSQNGNKRKRRRTDRTAQRKKSQAIKREIKNQEIAASRSRYLESVRTPFQYEGRLTNNAGYYAAIKKYKENISRGLIRPMSTLDKYEAADAFMNTLSEREQSDVMRIANEKAEQIMAREREEAATFTQRITERYSF